MAQNNYSQEKQDALSQSPSVNVGDDLKLELPPLPGDRPRGKNVLTPGDNLDPISKAFGVTSQAGEILSNANWIQSQSDNLNVLKALEYTTKFTQIQQNIHAAARVGEEDAIFVQEMTKLSVDAGTAYATNVGVRSVAAFLGLADGPEPGPVDAALQTAATFVISSKLSGEINNYLLDLDNPDRFGSLRRDADGWYQETPITGVNEEFTELDRS